MEIEFLPREAAAKNQYVSEDLNPLSCLTARQQEIVQLLLDGSSNKVIARQLGISPNTVKVHLHAIFRELRVHNRMSLAAALRPFMIYDASDDTKSENCNQNEEESLFSRAMID